MKKTEIVISIIIIGALAALGLLLLLIATD